MAKNCDVCGGFMLEVPSQKYDAKWRCPQCNFTKYDRGEQ